MICIENPLTGFYTMKTLLFSVLQANVANKKNWISYRWCSINKGVHKNFKNFARIHLCLSLFFNKATDVRAKTLLTQAFSYEFYGIFKNFFLQNNYLQFILGQLLLDETNQLIWAANQLDDFYKVTKLVFNRLRTQYIFS